MKNKVLVLAMCVALAACSSTKGAGNKPAADAPPVESLQTASDVAECEHLLGVTPPKTATDMYVMSADSLERVKDCAFGLEKQRMPLLADLIDKYGVMLRQGNQDCAKDIGTPYGDACMRKNKRDAAEWYNLAVSQKLRSELPGQSQEKSQSGTP